MKNLIKIPLREVFGRWRTMKSNWVPQEIKCSHFITPWEKYERQKPIHIKKIKRYTMYNWHKLEEDIIKKGQTTPITVIKLSECECGITKKFKYQVRNGEHRCFTLYKLYGDNHIVDAYNEKS